MTIPLFRPAAPLLLAFALVLSMATVAHADLRVWPGSSQVGSDSGKGPASGQRACPQTARQSQDQSFCLYDDVNFNYGHDNHLMLTMKIRAGCGWWSNLDDWSFHGLTSSWVNNSNRDIEVYEKANLGGRKLFTMWRFWYWGDVGKFNNDKASSFRVLCPVRVT